MITSDMQSGNTQKIKDASTALLKWLFINPLFLWVVVVPMLIVALYYTLVASDRFVSESKLTVKKADAYGSSSSSSGGSSLSSLLGSSGEKVDALMLKEYIYSFDMLNYLDKKLGLRKAYEDGNADYFSRIGSVFYTPTIEDLHDYYKNHVEIRYDDASDIITLKVDAFTADYAQKVNLCIVEKCDRFINDVSNKVSADQLRFIEQELFSVKARLEKEKIRTAEFQNKYKVLDPVAQAQAYQAFVGDMEKNLASMEAQLTNLRSFLSEDSYQIGAMKDQIKSLRQQIAKEKRLIAGEGSGHLNDVALRFINLQLDMSFIQDVYKTVLNALEQTRIDASRKHKSVVVIESPTLQEDAAYPRKLYILATVLALLLVVYGCIRLIVATIKEHKE